MFANRASIAEAQEHLKQNFEKLIPATILEETCQRWWSPRWRKRVFTPVSTVQCLLLQVLHGNTALSAMRWITRLSFSVGSYCKARMKIPVEVLNDLLRYTAQEHQVGEERWCGHRVFIVDGSSLGLPDTKELAEHYGYPVNQKPGCGFPVAKFVALLHFGTGRITAVMDDPWREHDMRQLSTLHARLQNNDILLADRAFPSFAHWGALKQKKLHGVLRQKIAHNQWLEFEQLFCANTKNKELHIVSDERVAVSKKPSTQRPRWMPEEEFQKLPAQITLRRIIYSIGSAGYRSRKFILETTLLDQESYTADKLAELYLQRWRIEVTFNALKTSMNMAVLRCTSVKGVRRELLAFVIIYNLVQRLLYRRAALQGIPPKRISFLDALRCLRKGEPLISLLTLASRPNRAEPRAVKRRPKAYPLLTKPRQHCIKQLQEA